MKTRSLVMAMLILTLAGPASGAENRWLGAGDGLSWIDGGNWSLGQEPTLIDDVRIVLATSSVVVTQPFEAQSLFLGAGGGDATVTVNSLVSGRIAPSLNTDLAIHNRKGGLLVLKGGGTVVVNGKYKSSEDLVLAQPSFVFTLR